MQYSCFAVVLREGEKEKEVLMVLNIPPDPQREKFAERDLGKAFFIKEVGWGCPGGSAKAKETPFDAVKREVKEEAGIDITADQHTAQFMTEPQNNHRKVFFLIEDWEGEPRPDLYEVFDVAWIPLSVVLYPGEEEDIGEWYVDPADNQRKRKKRRVVRYNGNIVYSGHRFCIRELLRKLGKLPT